MTIESSNDVWEAFLCIRASPYVGYLDVLAFDQKTQFTSTEWLNLSSAAEMSLKPSGAESHNATGVGERYHAYLRRIHNKVRASAPLLPITVLIALSIRAANNTAGPSGLVPSIPVFGILSRLTIRRTDLPGHVEMVEALVAVWNEMPDNVAKHRLNTALKRRVPYAANFKIPVQDEALMFCEPPVGKWVGA